jgi:hypothetical protein
MPGGCSAHRGSGGLGVGFTKRYGSLAAVCDVSFQVASAEKLGRSWVRVRWQEPIISLTVPPVNRPQFRGKKGRRPPSACVGGDGGRCGMPGDFASWDRQSRRLARRRRALLAGPVLVPVSMAAAFTVLDRLLGPRRGYNAGFALYWAGWCFAFPLWVLGGGRAMRLLSGGTRPSLTGAVWLMLPVAGAATAELLPNWRSVDRKVAGMMAGSALVNAVGEELLWRGAYLDTFPGDVWRGAIWP